MSGFGFVSLGSGQLIGGGGGGDGGQFNPYAIKLVPPANKTIR